MKVHNHSGYLIWLVVLLFPSILSAQGPYFKTVDLPPIFDEYAIELTAQGQDGFIWIGTDNGIFRFDGFEFRQYRFPGDSTENDVTAIHAQGRDTVWIGYRSGQMAFLTAGALKLFQPPEGNPGRKISAILHDRSGRLWYATHGEGIYVFNGTRVFNINMDDGLSDNFVYCLEGDGNGNVWAGTDRGINICSFADERKQTKAIGTAQGLPDNIVKVLHLRHDGQMLAGMYQGGICQIDVTNLRIVPLFKDIPWQFGEVLEFVPMNDQLWIVAEGRKLVQYKMGEKWFVREYGLEHNLPDDAFKHIAKDDEGNLWIVTRNSKISNVNLLFEIIERHEAFEFQNIHALLTDRQGFLWLFRDDELIRHSIDFTGRNLISKYDLPLPVGMQIISLYEDDLGFVWAGTFGIGVFRIDPQTGKYLQITSANGLVDDNVLNISGKEDTIWFATLGGVSHIHSTEVNGRQFLPFQTIRGADGLGNNYVYSVHSDRKGNTWFATDGNGLVKLRQDGRFLEYSLKSGDIESSVVYSIAEDDVGNIWFSTLKEGVYKFDGKTFFQYNTANGLKDMNISGLVVDKKNHLIIAHKRGVDILDIKTGSFWYYSDAYGLDHINPDLNTTSVDINGDIWLGTSRALIKYTLPDSAVRDRPRTVLEHPKVFLKPYDFKGDHILKFRQNHLTFHFNGLWFQNPEAVTYQYKLDGYDPDWVNTRDNEVIFPGLPPGKYHFSVRSTVNNTFEGHEVETFSFSVRPPVWKTWWFVGIGILAVIMALYFMVVTREKNAREKERREKEKILLEFENLKSQVNPHFLFNSFNSLISVIEDDRDKAVEYVEKLAKFFRNILTYRDEDLIPLGKELELARDYFYIHQQRYGTLVALDIDVPPDSLQLSIPPMTLQILIENAIKHNVVSASSPLRISIETSNGNLIVKNRIARKRTPDNSTGTGLKNIQNRYRILTRKKMSIINGPDFFTVHVPLINRTT